MPILNNRRNSFLSSSNGVKGKSSRNYHQLASKGVPRLDNLLTIRMLRDTHPVSLLSDKVKDQLVSAEWTIVPISDNPDEKDLELANDLEWFMKKGFNQNPESFKDLRNKLHLGTLSYDAGVIELVAGDDGYLSEMFSRDGMVFTKNPDDKGRLPAPGSSEPAYYQFGTSFIGLQDDVFNLNNGELSFKEISNFNKGFRGIKQIEPIAFSRDEIAWFEENPQEDLPYGFGRVQKIKRIAETILNQDIHAKRLTSQGEYSKGLLNFSGLSQNELERTREYWSSEIKGNPEKLPMTSAEGINYIPIAPSPQEMQFLESQRWYIKLAAMVFGLNRMEIGSGDDLAQNIGEEQMLQVYRNTTQPYLNKEQRFWNTQVIPYTREFNESSQGLMLKFKPTNKVLEKREREVNFKRLNNDVLTINEFREEEGKDTFEEWADLPLSVIRSIARANPDAIADMEGVDIDISKGLDDLMSFDGSEEVSEFRWDSWDFLFSYPERFLSMTYEAVRNERSNEFPALKSEEDDITQKVGKVFLDVFDDLEEEINKEFPEEEKDGQVLVNSDRIVENIDIQDKLFDVMLEGSLLGMEKGAEFEEKNVENMLEEQFVVPDEVQLNINFDLKNTLAMKVLRKRVLRDSSSVEDSFKSMVNNKILEVAEDGGGVQEATEVLKDRLDDISRRQARTVARTELLSASREGQQAFQESSDLVGGKKWVATDDSRTREWHSAMDGKVVEVDERFTVPDVGVKHQPDNYPRSTMVVGNEQPFNCRCTQQSVLEEDMPDSLNGLVQIEGVEVNGLSSKKLSVFEDYRQEGEGSFEEVMYRLFDNCSISSMEGEVASKPTLYKWKKSVYSN